MIRLIGTEGIRKRDFNEISREESKSEIIHERINTNKEKYVIDKTEHGEPLVTDNPVINDPRYFHLFECGKNILNRIDSMCKRACMATSRDRYYTEMFNTLTDYNDHKNTPLSNANIREEILKVIKGGINSR